MTLGPDRNGTVKHTYSMYFRVRTRYRLNTVLLGAYFSSASTCNIRNTLWMHFWIDLAGSESRLPPQITRILAPWIPQFLHRKKPTNACTIRACFHLVLPTCTCSLSFHIFRRIRLKLAGVSFLPIRRRDGTTIFREETSTMQPCLYNTSYRYLPYARPSVLV